MIRSDDNRASCAGDLLRHPVGEVLLRLIGCNVFKWQNCEYPTAPCFLEHRSCRRGRSVLPGDPARDPNRNDSGRQDGAGQRKRACPLTLTRGEFECGYEVRRRLVSVIGRFGNAATYDVERRRILHTRRTVSRERVGVQDVAERVD
jgi:hypothetical protein